MKKHRYQKTFSFILILDICLILHAAPMFAFAGNLADNDQPDWEKIAREITVNAQDQYHQAYLIYRWLCDNIDYDMTNSIFRADECYEQRRGVCQAYSELFYQLAKALEIDVDIVSGRVKGIQGGIKEEEHSWLLAYVDDDMEILVDPTWGAGTIGNGRFTRNHNDDSWFDVDPYWFIFTHFPDEKEYQLLSDHITWEAFLSLPYYSPALGLFGQQARPLFDACLMGDCPDLPDYYTQHFGIIDVISIPAEGELHVGRNYDFIVHRKKPVQLLIYAGSDYNLFTDTDIIDGWITDADNNDVCHFMPISGNDVIFAVQEGEAWSTIVRYSVASPTEAEIAAMEAVKPHRSPIWSGVEYFSTNLMLMHGVDIADLLDFVKQDGVKQLPRLSNAVKFQVGDIPWNGILHVGDTYFFSFYPEEGVQWALINGDDWYQEWEEDPETKMLSMSVTPQKSGSLQLGVKLKKNNEMYSGCIEYIVVDNQTF